MRLAKIASCSVLTASLVTLASPANADDRADFGDEMKTYTCE